MTFVEKAKPAAQQRSIPFLFDNATVTSLFANAPPTPKSTCQSTPLG